MVDARYMNKQNGKVAVIVQEDTKHKTVLLQFEDTGKEQQVAMSTLKRYWKEIEEDDEDEDIEDEEELDEEDEEYEEEEDEEDEGDDADEDGDDEDEDEEDEDEEEYEEDDVEESEDDEEVDDDEEEEEEPEPKKVKKAPATKEKKERKPRQKAEPNPEVAMILDYLFKQAEKLKGEVVSSKKGSATGSMKYEGHRFLKYRSTKTGVTVCFRPDAIKGVIKPKKTTKYMFGAECYFDTLTKEAKVDIDKAMKASVDILKQKVKEKEAEKKASKK